MVWKLRPRRACFMISILWGDCNRKITYIAVWSEKPGNNAIVDNRRGGILPPEACIMLSKFAILGRTQFAPTV